MTSHVHQNETSTSLGAANCETAATLGGCWGLQRSDAPSRTQTRPRQPWGAANCESVGSFVGPWEVQQGGVPRRSE